MRLNKIIQRDYTSFSLYYQIKLPLDLEISIPSDDPVRKEDMNFRRYLYRGKANALAESILLAMGRNINKLNCKIQTGRTGSHLFLLKTA